MQWIHPLRCAAAALVLSASLAGASAYAQVTSEEAAQPASATDKPSADDLLKEIDSTKPPKLDESRKEDKAYIEEHVAASRKAIKQKADLCAQFVEMYPDHPKANATRLLRWRLLGGFGEQDKLASETEAYLKQPGHESDADALFMNARATMLARVADPVKSRAAIERFIAAQPKDERGAQLLYSLVQRDAKSDDNRKILDRIIAQYPASATAAYAKGQIRRSEELGKPLALSFTDAISGKQIAMSDLKGKVVVLDFWATWCGPCVAEMPHMKELYSKLKSQGVEFIGVSLDEKEADGGLGKLKEYVAKNEIPWPQYYQGNGWESEFSKSWGVNSIPCVFVVDPSGNLASADAGDQLEKLVTDLIAKRDGKSAKAE